MSDHLKLQALAEVKQQARKIAFANRKQAFEADQAAGKPSARILADLFEKQITLDSTDIVAVYRPIRTEIDPTILMMRLHAQGIVLAVPVIEAADHPLTFMSWTPDSIMHAGAFGAEIPVSGQIVEPTVILAPLVAFDRHCARLGYGGGFYDRSLEGLRAKRPTRAYGLAFAAQEIPQVPLETTDQPLDAILTEKEMIFPK